MQSSRAELQALWAEEENLKSELSSLQKEVSAAGHRVSRLQERVVQARRLLEESDIAERRLRQELESAVDTMRKKRDAHVVQSPSRAPAPQGVPHGAARSVQHASSVQHRMRAHGQPEEDSDDDFLRDDGRAGTGGRRGEDSSYSSEDEAWR